jgi:hypothetical protein
MPFVCSLFPLFWYDLYHDLRSYNKFGNSKKKKMPSLSRIKCSVWLLIYLKLSVTLEYQESIDYIFPIIRTM